MEAGIQGVKARAHEAWQRHRDLFLDAQEHFEQWAGMPAPDSTPSLPLRRWSYELFELALTLKEPWALKVQQGQDPDTGTIGASQIKCEDKDLETEEAAVCREAAADASSVRRAPTTNRGPSESQLPTFEADKLKVLASLDWLDVSLVVEWSPGSFRSEAKDWNRAREAAQDEAVDGSDMVPNVAGWPICPHWSVRPSGLRHGRAGICQWVLEQAGIRVDIADRVTPLRGMPNVFVHIGAAAIMQFGALRCLWMVADYIETCGGHVVRDTVSRVDIACDLFGIPLLWFTRKWFDHKFVTTLRNDFQDFRSRRKYTSHICGKEVRLRIYDKVVESSRDPAKTAIWLRARGVGPTDFTECTRVEFQLRNDQLRDAYSIVSVCELFGKLESLCDHLTSEVFRFTTEQPDRKNNHVSRAKTWSTWCLVRDGFKAFAANPIAASIGRRVLSVIKPKQLLDQIRGCVASVLAVWRNDERDISDDLGTIVDLLCESDLDGLVQKRRRALIKQGRIVGVAGCAGDVVLIEGKEREFVPF